MSCISHTRHILMRDGTNQFERLMDALKPSFVLVDERTREDLMRFIGDFAGLVQYYNESNSRDGDWIDFFDDFSRTQEPMMALAMTFIELYQKVKDHLNEFTLRHLEFYYKKILQIREKPAEPDRVHLVLELAKSVSEFKLDKGTSFKAGKDATGKELIYEAGSEIVLNKAQVNALKTIYHDKGTEGRLYAAPVANSADGIGAPIQTTEARWFTFGRNQSGLFEGQRTMIDGRIGFAVASPLLFLNEGSRSVRLRFQFHSLPSGSGKMLSDILSLNYTGVFQAYLSGKKGWIGPSVVSISKTTDNAGLDFTISLGPEEEPVVAYDPGVLGGSFDTTSPIIKIVLNESHEPCPLNDLLLLKAKSLNISVTIKGAQNLILENDLGRLDASKPFQPFGPAPVVGSQFLAGSTEVFGKRLDSLELVFKWKDLPGTFNGFDGYYIGYKKSYTTSGFKMNVSCLQDKAWNPASNTESLTLFDIYYDFIQMQVTQPAATPKASAGKKKVLKKKKSDEISVEKMGIDVLGSFIMETPVYYYPSVMILPYLSKGEIRRTVDVSRLNLRLQGSPASFAEYSNSSVYGFLKMELSSQDFGHKEYPSVHTAQAIALSKHILDGASGAAPALPNAPYTPQLEYLKMDYSASENIAIEGNPDSKGTYFHLEPFGEFSTLAKTGSGMPLLPPVNFEGALFIGLKDLVPRQNLSMLFQFAESSSASENFIDPKDLEWSYLSKDQWIPMQSREVISDSTNGFLTSGIIVLDISGDATSDNHRMAAGLHWLRLAAASNALGVNQLIDIRTQAVEAVFTDNGNDPQHLSSSLPAESISKLVTARPEVKKITQPFSSFGGRPAENDQPFYPPYYTRVSERLRHKNRLITIWDAERMVLEEFPKTYKVKCLNHSSEKNDISPGHITLVAIENIRNKNAVNPLQPRTSLDTLAKIRAFMEKYVSPFVTVHVQNPIYEEILVDFKVAFMPGYDAGYYRQVLNEEIKKFLSPWAYVEGEDIIFGNIIYKSSIVNFIEKREYVDYVTDFKMFHILDSWGIGCMEVGDDFVVGDQDKILDLDEAVAKTSRSILVSAEEHQIYVLSPGEYVCEGVSS